MTVQEFLAEMTEYYNNECMLAQRDGRPSPPYTSQELAKVIINWTTCPTSAKPIWLEAIDYAYRNDMEPITKLVNSDELPFDWK